MKRMLLLCLWLIPGAVVGQPWITNPPRVTGDLVGLNDSLGTKATTAALADTAATKLKRSAWVDSTAAIDSSKITDGKLGVVDIGGLGTTLNAKAGSVAMAESLATFTKRAVVGDTVRLHLSDSLNTPRFVDSTLALAKPVAVDSLIFYMPLDSNTQDYSGKNLHSVMTVQATPRTMPDSFRVGIGAYAFDGVNDSIRVADNVLLDNTTRLTVMAWVYLYDGVTANSQTIITKNASGDQSWVFRITPSGKITFLVTNTAGSLDATRVSLAGLSNGNTGWHHVAGVFEGSKTLTTYLDGVSAGDSTLVGTIPAAIRNGGQPVLIGIGAAATNDLWGLIDEVRIYQRALSASAIQRFYANAAEAHLRDTKISRYFKIETDTTGAAVGVLMFFNDSLWFHGTQAWINLGR